MEIGPYWELRQDVLSVYQAIKCVRTTSFVRELNAENANKGIIRTEDANQGGLDRNYLRELAEILKVRFHNDGRR